MKPFLILATIFLFASCVDIERGNPEDPGSRNYNVNRLSSSPSVELSSSSEPSSSSSVVKSSSSSMLSNSSSALPSSSSVAASSSSAAVSSSSSMLSSSSSALPSSSSVAISSSSLEESSSSSMLSSSSGALPSSSSVASCIGFVNGTKREHYGMEKEQFCDERDGKKYVYVEIGTQIWMAENLNYHAPNSRCYGDNTGEDSQDNCAIYGRLYNWATAMDIDAKYNSQLYGGSDVKHKGVCPEGWHIPNNAEWNTLMKFVKPSCTDNSFCGGAGTKLKSATGWKSYSGVPTGTDDYGFSALPGGYGDSGGAFGNVGNRGYWWSASEGNSNIAYYRDMLYHLEYAGYDSISKEYLLSVRCLQD